MNARETLLCGIMLLSGLCVPASAEEKKEAGGSTSPPEITIQGQLRTDSPRSRHTGMPSSLHTVKLEKDQTYVILLQGKGMNPFVTIEDTIGNVLAQGFNRGNDQARVRFTSPKNDAFLIYASGIANNDAKYTLTVRPHVAAPIKLISLPAPTSKAAAETQGVLSEDDTPEQFRDFPGKVYTVELKAKQAYVLDLMSKDFDTYLLLQDANGVLIAQDDDSGGNLNSRIRFTPLASGRYRIVASTFNGRMGPYSLRIAEAP